MSRLVEELVEYGHHCNLMKSGILSWVGSTTSAGIQMQILMESGATPLTQTWNGSTALFQYVSTGPRTQPGAKHCRLPPAIRAIKSVK